MQHRESNFMSNKKCNFMQQQNKLIKMFLVKLVAVLVVEAFLAFKIVLFYVSLAFYLKRMENPFLIRNFNRVWWKTFNFIALLLSVFCFVLGAFLQRFILLKVFLAANDLIEFYVTRCFNVCFHSPLARLSFSFNFSISFPFWFLHYFSLWFFCCYLLTFFCLSTIRVRPLS